MARKQTHLDVTTYVKVIFLSLLAAQPVVAAARNLVFWPTSINEIDKNKTGTLYAWPEFSVLLHEKTGPSQYEPAVINQAIVDELSLIFKPPNNSPIILNDRNTGHFGLRIAGGATLIKNNQHLLTPMLKGFLDCLKVLDVNELDRVKEIIYSPHSFILPTGKIIGTEDHVNIARKMFHLYRQNRCASGSIGIDERTAVHVKNILLTLLVGKHDGEKIIHDGSLLIFTTIFDDLLFAKDGLWVRAVLLMIREFVENTLSQFPSLSDTNVLARNYNNYLDVILSTRKQKQLSKGHYLSLGAICNIRRAADVFLPCPLNQLFETNQIEVLNLTIDATHSTHFVRTYR